MFGLMKNLMKESSAPADSMTLAELHPGCVLGFGFVPQKNISGKRLPVAEVNSYLFDEDSFIAYRLSGESSDVNLIVADEEDPSGTYLALAQRIEPRLFDSLFTGKSPASWFSLKESDKLEVKPPVLGALTGWLTTHYTVAVVTIGRYLEGDYRLRKPADRTRLSREFDYVLLVDEENEFALEAEKHNNGTIQVFATVYRPATDIGEITRAPKALVTSSVETIPHVPPADPKPVAAISGSSAQILTAEPVKSAEKPKANVEIAIVKSSDAVKGEGSEGVTAKLPAVTVELKADDKKVEAIVEAVADIVMAESKRDDDEDEELKTEAKAPEVKLPEPKEPEAKTAPVEAPEPAVPESKPVPEAKTVPVEMANPAVPESEPVADAKPVKDEIFSVTVPEIKTPEVKPEPAELTKPAAPEVKAEIAEPAAASALTPEPATEVTSPVAKVLPEVSVHSKFGRIQPAASEESNLLSRALPCDLKLAGRLIEEAQRNQLPLSEVIRKVIDLPARVEDKVFIPFDMSDAEVAELARRYHLDPGDTEGVKQQVLEELGRFAGEKK